MIEFDLETVEKSYASIPGGPELLAFFGAVPSFHDAEIVGLELNRTGNSYLKIHGWVVESSNVMHWKAAKHAVVTFVLQGITDLQLDSFSRQNVIGSLMIARTAIDPERKPFCSLEGHNDQNYEVVLEPCYGLNGRIRCKSISITFEPKIPNDAPLDWKKITEASEK